MIKVTEILNLEDFSYGFTIESSDKVNIVPLSKQDILQKFGQLLTDKQRNDLQQM